MDSTTLELVDMARAGDGAAWSELACRFHSDWLDVFHNALGATLHQNVGDTESLVSSALDESLETLPHLRNEAVLFTWTTWLIRRKIGAWRYRLLADRADDRTTVEPAAPGVDKLTTYVETLDAIIALYPAHPEEMAAVSWKNLDQCSLTEIASRLHASESVAQLRLRAGLAALQEHLNEHG